MKRSHLARTLVRIGLFVTMGIFTVQLGLVQRAEAAPKSDPVAVVGGDFKVLVGETVTADGRLSYDPKGKKLHFKWELVQVPPNSSAKLSKKNSPTPSFIADKHGRYIIQLRVSNNGIKWSDTVRLNVATDYPSNALVAVNTRLVEKPISTTNPLARYIILVGENYYMAPLYKAGTEISTPTGFQVLVLERDTLLPATQYTYHQSFSGTMQGYSDMIQFLKSLTDKGLLVIISPFDDTLLDKFPVQQSQLATEILRLGGTEDFMWILKAPKDVYTLIGTPGIGAGNGIEMCGWDHFGSSRNAAIKGIFTKDKYANFQFIYPDFTAFETKSWADSGGNFSGSAIMGSVEFAAPLPGGKLPPGQGAFQVVYFRRDNADWASAPPNVSVWLTNVPGQESPSVKNMVAQLKGLTSSNSSGFGFPSPDSYMVIIQSIGVPFGATSLYDQQSVMDLEKLINNLGGSEYAFHAIFKNPGTAASPNKYSLLGIAMDDLSVTMPTIPRLGPTESVEASTLNLQDGTWTVVSGSDGNVRGVINKNKQGMYIPFLASEGVASADLSLPIILFQDPTPWITGPAGEDPTPYLAAYSWISTYITGAPPQNLNGTCSTPGAVIIKGGTCGDLRTYYPTIDNLWNTVDSLLYGTGAMDAQVNMFCQSATGKGSDFNCEQYQWMKNQLYREVQKVEVAKELFQDDIGNFFKDLATYQSLSLSEFYANAYNTLGIDPQSPNPTQSILNVVQSVFTRVSLMGLAKGKPAVAVIGGIASAAVAVASHFIPDSNANPVAGVISTTIEDLWQDLTTNFLTEDFVVRKSYELVVSDWGKLQAAENLWNQWDQDTTEQALASMIVGFEAYLYEVLIPLAYKVEKLPGTQGSTLTDFKTCSKSWNTGNKCEYYGYHAGVPLPNYVALPSQAWDPLQARQANDLYWVYKGNHTTGNFSYIPKTTLDNIFAPFDYYDLTKLGVSKVDFFTRWPFTYSDCPLYDDWCYTCGYLW